jgi:hypothetical protein
MLAKKFCDDSISYCLHAQHLGAAIINSFYEPNHISVVKIGCMHELQLKFQDRGNKKDLKNSTIVNSQLQENKEIKNNSKTKVTILDSLKIF